MEIRTHYPLKELNTFGIEVFAREFAEVTTDEELYDLVLDNLMHTKRVLFLGGGSNVLFKDDFDGLLVHINTRGINIIRETPEEIDLRVSAGEEWDGLVGYSVDRGWGGLENLSGIPGKVGSSPIQNIGAYGTELKDHFLSLEAINTCSGEKVSFTRELCHFDYRDSVFKSALRGRFVITSVILRLQKKPVFNLSYPALKQKLANLEEKEVTLKRVRETVLQIRASKLPDTKLIGNAGSFFKNPLVSAAKMEVLKERYPGIVCYEVPAVSPHPVPLPQQGGGGSYKLSAGWLIEQCGWKGYRDGDAGVHRDQALVLVNYGRATGREILDLAGKIRRSVNEKFGVELEKEVNVI